MVIAWHSFFHLSGEDQRKMFKVFRDHMKKGAVLLFTSGAEEGEIWGNNGGENLYHASLSPQEYKILLKNHGFVLLEHKSEDPECGGATVWLVRKK